MKEDYIPKSRNKVLVEVLSKSGIMDKRGSGVLRIRMVMFGKRIRDIVKKNFDWDNIIKRYIKVYDSIRKET